MIVGKLAVEGFRTLVTSRIERLTASMDRNSCLSFQLGAFAINAEEAHQIVHLSLYSKSWTLPVARLKLGRFTI